MVRAVHGRVRRLRMQQGGFYRAAENRDFQYLPSIEFLDSSSHASQEPNRQHQTNHELTFDLQDLLDLRRFREEEPSEELCDDLGTDRVAHGSDALGQLFRRTKEARGAAVHLTDIEHARQYRLPI